MPINANSFSEILTLQVSLLTTTCFVTGFPPSEGLNVNTQVPVLFVSAVASTVPLDCTNDEIVTVKSLPTGTSSVVVSLLS